MKYKIDLRDYVMPKANEKDKDKPYEVKRIIFSVMLSPNQGHKGFRFYTISKLAKRIRDRKEDFIILSEADYNIIKGLFDSCTGFSAVDTECVSRIYEPEIIDED